MMAVQMPPIPAARTTDDEEVHLALTTAAALDTAGSRADALRWLRRAAEAAADLDDDRALELCCAVSDLAASLRSVSSGPSHSERPAPVAAPISTSPPATTRTGTRPPPPLPSRRSSAAPPRSVPAPRSVAAPPPTPRASVPPTPPTPPASLRALPLPLPPPPRRDDSVVATRVAVAAGPRKGELVLLPAGQGQGRAWAMLVPLSSADAEEIQALLAR